MKRVLSVTLTLSLFVFSAKADPLKDFLMSCVYGTAGGAVLGLTTLAFSDDPGGKTNNIARGASLGLYVGIGTGLVQVYGKKERSAELSESTFWLEPKWKLGKVEGADLKLHIFEF